MGADISQSKRQFLEGEVMLLTLSGGLSTRDRKFRIYRDQLGDECRDKIRRAIREKLTGLGASYVTACPEEAHLANIEDLANHLTNQFRDDLHKNRFRIGVSQKLLNLYVKYHWVLGWIPEPCHCPFDSVIIEELKLAKKINWTALDDINEYLSLVEAAKKVSAKAGQSVAQWELANWKLRDRDSLITEAVPL